MYKLTQASPEIPYCNLGRYVTALRAATSATHTLLLLLSACCPETPDNFAGVFPPPKFLAASDKLCALFDMSFPVHC
jgi:hypothetical protein